MVATGAGIAPFRAFLQELAKRGSENGTEAVLLFGVRTPDHLLYIDEFESWLSDD
jgi:sulfite reductase alpha subunit-like flavoprotein